MSDGKKFLSEREMMTIELNNERLKNTKLQMSVSDLQIKNNELGIALLEARLEALKKDRETITKKHDNDIHQAQVSKQKAEEYLSVLAESLDIPKDKKWGYNPETGEVVIQ